MSRSGAHSIAHSTSSQTGRFVIACAVAAGAFALLFASLTSPFIALGLIAVVIAVVLPTTVASLSLAWVLVCRPSQELLHFSVAGVNLTEVDLLIVLATISSFAIPRREVGPAPRRLWHLALGLLAWPAWLTIRLALPTLAPVLSGSSAVDIRLITAYLAFVPILVLIVRRGGRFGLRLLAYASYISCAIAIAGWLALASHLTRPFQSAVVNVLELTTVRPGGELLVVLVGVLAFAGHAPTLFGTRWIPAVLILGELAVSQTLSMVIAIAAGSVLAWATTWRLRSLGSKTLIVICALLVAAIPLSGALSDSRFNLDRRLGEDSAGYREAELTAIEDVLESAPERMFLGEGPGSLIAVPNPYTGLTDVKRDSHNVYAAVALKGGIVGVVLYALPYLALMVALLRSRRAFGRASGAALGAALIVGITVPFAWTMAGTVGLWLFAFSALVVSTPRHVEEQENA